MELLEVVLELNWRGPLTIQGMVLQAGPLPEVDWEESKKIPFWVVRTEVKVSPNPG